MSSDKKRPLEDASPEDENPAKKMKLETSSTSVDAETTEAPAVVPAIKPENNNNTEIKKENAGAGNKGGNDDDEDEIDAATGKKIPKRRVALLVGYLGANFQGLQKNPGVRTIEDELLNAIHAAGGISEVNAGNLRKVNWGRSARTDKGVSAIGNIIALKLILQDNIIERINQHATSEIKVFDMRRVGKRFNPKSRCNGRTYQYFLPTYAFKPVKKIENPDVQTNTNETPVQVDPIEGEKPTADGEKPKVVKTALWAETDEPFEFTEETREKINATLKRYIGSHNFHNFTNSIAPKDKKCQRIVTSFECSKPFKLGDQEWVALTVQGQSFVLHQIRKMVGMMVPVIKGMADTSIIDKCFRFSKKFSTPLAPGFCLVLIECDFKLYNKGCAPHQPMEWSNVQTDLDKFKNEVILPHIANQEKTQGLFDKWLNDVYSYEFDYEKQAVEVPKDKLFNTGSKKQQKKPRISRNEEDALKNAAAAENKEGEAKVAEMDDAAEEDDDEDE